MRRLLLAAGALLAFSAAAHAQGMSALVVATCGTPPITYTAGQSFPITMDTNGNICGATSGGGTITPVPKSVTPTDRGGTMTTGGTVQPLAASNASRQSIVIVNPCSATSQGGIAAAESLYISVTGNATVAGAANYAELAPCGSTAVVVANEVYTGAITVNAATTGHRWMATEWQ